MAFKPYVSGAEQFSLEIAERLCGTYEFVVLTSRFSRENPKNEVMNSKNGCTYRVIRIGPGTRFDKWLYALAAPFLAIRIKPDIVHAVMESYAGIALGIFKILRPGVKTILTLQSGDLDDPRKRFQGIWKKFIHRSPDHITAISKFLASRAVRLGVSKDKISVIPNGVDGEKIGQIAQTAGSKLPYRIVCVARLSWEKGHKYLVEALAKVRKELPGAHLVLVGDGPERKNLELRIKDHELGEAVTLLGALPHDEAIKEIAKAEIFVCPSLAEGLGIVFIEAQAVGVPVVGTNVGGIPDVIEDGETGLLVPPKNSQALAGAITKVLGDRTLRERLATQSKSRLGRFEWSDIAGRVAQIYEKP